MSSLKQIKLAQQAAAHQRAVILELESLVKSIERCEKTITELKSELDAVNAKYQTRATTEQEIGYLTDLLKCAHKKLAWEKQIASVRKRTPSILEQMASLINDPMNPPEEQMKQGMLRALQGVQAAMERLQMFKGPPAEGTPPSGEASAG